MSNQIAMEESLLISETPLSVSQLTNLIRADLENHYPDIRVEGELSNCKIAASGHLYFSLKDEQAVLQGVMFRRDLLTLSFVPSDGMKILARGGISVYAARGQYQLIARSMSHAGLGEILAMLEARKKKLAAEGLFDASRKKPLPFLPERIGVITSPSGAVIRDIIKVLRRRNPKAGIILLPALVQGETAAASIAERIIQANRWDLVDVLIVGRGGGSIEDLLPFSDERVVRAVAQSHIPIISAVGHETDWALCDYAADVRAPTPSAAAELASGDIGLVMREIDQFSAIFAHSMKRVLARTKERLSAVSPRMMEALLVRKHLELTQRFDSTVDRMRNLMEFRMGQMQRRLELADTTIGIANPQAIMRRGFSIVMKMGPLMTAPVIRAASEVQPGEQVHIIFASGKASASILETMQE
ncbi:MAG: exodeoxyribonuclease VII large subunit [Rectinema sp.]|nr:exodeoxyribonuclease VII large subunit [Rectinema sp.]